MHWRDWLWVSLVLSPLYAGVGALAYWLLWPLPPTVRVVYSAPAFCDRPCESREAAETYAVREVPNGTPYVWHYREIEVIRQAHGIIRSSWHSGAFVWQAPARPTVGSRPGLYARSAAIEPPTSNPTRDFEWNYALAYNLTPLRDEIVHFPPVRLRVLAGDGK